MTTLTHTSQELTDARRTYLSSMFVKMYFRKKPVFSRDNYMDKLMDMLFVMPSVSRSIHRTFYLRKSAARRAFKEQLGLVLKGIE